MAPRPMLDDKLIEIKKHIEIMANMVTEDINKAVTSLGHMDINLAREVIDNGDLVDDKEEEINQICFDFLARQAPIASDLRYCISSMKMVRDLERIGDQAENIAKYTIRGDILENTDSEEISRMAEMAISMIKNSIQAFLNKDLKLARKVWRRDEDVDELFRRIYAKEIELIERGENVKTNISYAFVALHLERVADYATNICEDVLFIVDGEMNMNEDID